MTLVAHGGAGPSQLSCDEARSLTEEIRSDLSVLWEKVIRAWRGKAWQALGYASWDEYVDNEFVLFRIKLPRAERLEVVSALFDAEMPIKAIARTTGLARNTVKSLLGGQFDPPAGHEPEVHDAEIVDPSGDIGELVEGRGPRAVTGLDGKAYRPPRKPRLKIVDPPPPAPLVEIDLPEMADRIQRYSAQADPDSMPDEALRTLADEADRLSGAAEFLRDLSRGALSVRNKQTLNS